MPKVEQLRSCTFQGSSLKTGEFESITTIRSSVFVNCQQLTSLVFGEHLAKMSDSTICSNCPLLKTVTVKAIAPPASDSTPFSRCTALTNIYVPEGSIDAYKAAKGWSKYVDKISAIPAASSAPAEVALLPDRKD